MQASLGSHAHDAMCEAGLIEEELVAEELLLRSLL